jgi:NTE family protein
VGGCTAHHAMIVIRPNDADWDWLAGYTDDASWRSDNIFASNGHVDAIQRSTPNWNIDNTPVSLLASVNNQVWSPAFFLQCDWLAAVLGNKIDFNALQAQTNPPELYIATTNITEGRRDIFARTAVTLEVLKASASIPQVFLPPKYGESYYWDGGFMGNPAITPLITHATDVVIIQLNPFSREEPPLTAMQINNRVNEITFNSSLVHEINAICAVNKMIDYFEALGKENDIAKEAARLLPVNKVNLYRITNEPFLRTLGYASKAVIVKDFLIELREQGRDAADKWLNEYLPLLADTAPPHTGIPGQPTDRQREFPADVIDKTLSRRHIIR